ncbi:MAG TPA: PGF-pre-PGF domain-containing protein [archaeon]|nr:PGF-pre-PGF domain-containing protein [archaeon]
MSWKVAPMLAVLALFLLLSAPQAQALPCSTDLTLTTPASSIDQYSLFNVVLSTTAGSPSNPWGSYTNSTLNTDSLTIQNGTSFLDFLTSPVNESASYTWKINSTILGSKLLNLTVANSTGSACEKTLSLNVTEATDPNLVLTTDNKTEVAANKPFTYTVNLNNTGNENATNITIELDIFESNITPSIPLSISPIPNSTSASQSFTLTPLACRQYELTTLIKYKDTSGNSRTNVQNLDQYVANSSDLLLNSFSLSAASVTEGGAVTFSAEVKNIAERNSTGFNVTFYKNTVSDSSRLVTATSNSTLAYLESRNVSTSWTSSGAGSPTILAVVDAFDGDCDLNNTQKTAALTINAVTNPNTGSSANNPTSPSPTINTACTYNWECGDWSVCSSESKQARSCLNKGTCTGVEGKPEESQSCVFVAVPVEESKKIEKIEKDATQTITFEKDVSIQEISITAKDLIEGANIKVKTLVSKPVNIENLTGVVYKYLEIIHDNIEGKIGKATIKFKIEKSWLGANKIDKSKVALSRFTSKWDKLNTKLLSEDNITLVYEAETPGFSVFAISGEELKEGSDQQSSGPQIGGPTGLVIGGSTLAGIVIVVAALIAIAILTISGKRNKNMNIKVKKR